MSNIGATLKEARNKKEITLEDVHAKLKIHPRVLQLLEEEKFDKLPSPLFAKSFLKSYAMFLEVDADSLLESYEKEKKPAEPEQKLYLSPANMNPSRRFSNKLLMIAGGALLAMALLFASVSKPISNWAVKMKEARAHAPAKEKKEKEKKEKKVAEIKQVKAEEKVAAAPAPETKPTEEWLNSVKLGNFPKIPKKTALELQVKALDGVWVHVTCDGKVLFQGVIKKGNAEVLQAKDTIEVWTGNAASMTLTLNKTALGSPGKGVVKKMLISHEGIRIVTSAGE